jgi:asparagine synthase (glutamine-hydrolysing)
MLLQRWSGAVRLMPRHVPVGSVAKKERYRRLASAAREKDIAERYRRLTEICPPELLNTLIPADQEIGDPGNANLLIGDGIAQGATPFRHGLLADQIDYLPGDLLYKVDSASMADALEVRAPFLDHHVVEFANALSDDQLLRGGISKFILRRAFADAIPPAILARGKKGFAVPIGDWFRTSLRPALDMLTAADSFCTTHLQPRPIRELIDQHLAGTRDHTHRLFALLMLELFWKEFSPTLE